MKSKSLLTLVLICAMSSLAQAGGGDKSGGSIDGGEVRVGGGGGIDGGEVRVGGGGGRGKDGAKDITGYSSYTCKNGDIVFCDQSDGCSSEDKCAPVNPLQTDEIPST